VQASAILGSLQCGDVADSFIVTPHSELLVNRRVLLVDDDRAIHAVYRRILGGRRETMPTFELQSAFQGAEALGFVEDAAKTERPFAMAFVDLRMPPEWDGIETIRRLWQVDRHLQIVICSGHCEDDWAEIARDFGRADGFLMLKKPFANVEVRQMAQALTSKWSLEQAARGERQRMEAELRLAQKLEAVGQLAAGIAHEINTPMQYIGDSVHFLHRAFDDLLAGELEPDDVEYMRNQIPRAFERTLEGIERVVTIVRAMRDFAHPGQREKAPADLNRAIDSAQIVSRNEYKYVADVETQFGQLPLVECQLGELNQVFLNLIINAAHAIGERGSEARGIIKITTSRTDDAVRISLADTGCGIPERVRDRIFDPFFTTKPVGKGTGQGLAIARTIVVDKHAGRLSFETEVGHGTTFHIDLPVAEAS